MITFILIKSLEHPHHHHRHEAAGGSLVIAGSSSNHQINPSSVFANRADSNSHKCRKSTESVFPSISQTMFTKHWTKVHDTHWQSSHGLIENQTKKPRSKPTALLRRKPSYNCCNYLPPSPSSTTFGRGSLFLFSPLLGVSLLRGTVLLFPATMSANVGTVAGELAIFGLLYLFSMQTFKRAALKLVFPIEEDIGSNMVQLGDRCERIR